MLPNEIYLDVFRWLDRRVLETKLRLVSRNANDLVQMLAGQPPYIFIANVSVTAYSDNYIEFELMFYRPLNSIDPGQPQRRPFDVYEAGSVPFYLLIRKLSISECGMWKFPDNDDNDEGEDNHMIYSWIIHDQMQYRDSAYLKFAARYEQDNKTILSSLYANCWNCQMLSADTVRPGPDIFVTRTFQTTLRMCVRSIRSEIVAPIADWLATPAKPEWLNEGLRKTFDGSHIALTDLKRLHRILNEQFTNSTSPSSYKLTCYVSEGREQLKCEINRRADRPGEILCAHYCVGNAFECWRGPVKSLPVKWEECKQITTPQL